MKKTNFFFRLKQAWNVLFGGKKEQEQKSAVDLKELFDYIKGFEKLLHYMAYNMDLQAKAIKQNTDALNSYSSSIEELSNFLEQINAVRNQRQQNVVNSSAEEEFIGEDDTEASSRKKFLN